VGRWLQRLSTDPSEAVIAINGGLDRDAEIRGHLAEVWGGETGGSALEVWRSYLGVLAAVGIALLAMAFDILRRQMRRDLLDETHGLWTHPVGRPLQILVPGLTSAELGRGGRGLLAIVLVVAPLALLVVARYGVRFPLGYDPGAPWAGLLATLLLLAVYAVRFGLSRMD
jgi:hypothetical protein